MRKKNKKYKEVIFNLIVYMILLFILIYSGIKIYKWYKDKTSNKEIVEQIKETVVVEDKNEYKEEYTIDFNKLKEQNKETVAWIKVNNTNIEYPVVKANNNNFYLNHSFDKSENLAGWIFADYRNKFDNTDKNIIIYGHNMRDGSMFGSLKNILNSDWYENEENTNITLYTENEKCIYKVFSIYKIESEDYYIKTEFSNAKRFKSEHTKTPFLSARNKDKNFYDMCEVIGPPSRVMHWCCTVFKTGAITKKINGVFKDKKNILTFYGIRRSESASRNKYDRVSDSPKITKQNVVSPIIDWIDFDVWLYILTTKIDFNDAYRFGYSRVGCWCCPNNTLWAQYLSKIYMPEQSKKWRDQLISFAIKVGKKDPEVYVDDGMWKARQGGNGVEYSENTFVEFKPCATEKESFNYELNKPISEELYEFFKPFGWINKEMGNSRLGQVYVTDKIGNPILRLQGKK